MENLKSAMSLGAEYPPSYHTYATPSTPDPPDWMTSLNQPYGINEDRYPCTTGPGYGGKYINASQPCRFLHDVPDRCYKNRFFARALEFYYLEQNIFPPDKAYPCLMFNCPQKDFKDPREMLRHLKQCEFFPQGRFRCPACHDASSFRKLAERRCSWDAARLGSKLRRTLKSPMTIIKDMMRRNSAPNPSIDGSEFEQRATGEEVNLSGISELPSKFEKEWMRGVNPLEISELPSKLEKGVIGGFNPFGISELESQLHFSELDGGQSIFDSQISLPKPESTRKGRAELEGSRRDSQCIIPELECPQPFTKRHTRPIDTSYNLLSQVSPSQLSSTSSKSLDECFSDVSPTSGTTATQSTPTDNPDPRMINPTIHQGLNDHQSMHQEMDHIESEYPDLSDFWQSCPSVFAPNTGLILNESSSLIGQVGLQNDRGPPPLSLDTGCMMGGFNDHMYDRDSFKCDTGAWKFVQNINSLFQQPPLGEYNANGLSFPSTVEEAAAPKEQIFDERDYSPHSKPVDLSPSSFDGSPTTESPTGDTQLKCDLCDFVPTGKPENLRAYRRKHMKTHEDLTPLPCPHCETRFTRQDNLTTHIRIYHPDFRASPCVPYRKRKRSSHSLKGATPKRRSIAT